MADVKSRGYENEAESKCCLIDFQIPLLDQSSPSLEYFVCIAALMLALAFNVKVVYSLSHKSVNISVIAFSLNFAQGVFVEEKDNSTQCSQAVTHPSTNRAQCCLTSVIGRELVFSTWYGRCRRRVSTVSYTHLTLPTIYSV